MTSREIRKSFLDFFASKEHKIVPSAPLVLKNDPTLMFTNSGMVQFKDYFLGNGTPPSKRIADTQKCLRVSGKHNDLEDVGFDGTHHTMFEMLGNWSFGDYFKKDAINWSWEFLHTTLGLPADRLYATVFGGDASEGLESDEEARNYWRQYLPDNQILDGSKKDNFWEMGAQGPCGPCSEIHFDFRSDEERAKVPGEKLVNMDDPSVVEIWNNVFMQFERKADGSLVVLPAQHVDTGMGFERLCMVMQGKKFTYDTDIFTPFIQLVEKESGKTYNGSYDRAAKTDVAMRVIVDHIRAVAFTIADGQLPSSGGAGYVIRRILRRAVRYYYSFLDIKEPLLNKLIPLLSSEFADVFPELKAQEAFVQKVILEEEKSFLRTLELGLKRFETLNTEGSLVKGSEAFEMFDTYGFPIDLTELLASERGLKVDTAGFDAALLEQKQRSKRDAEKQVGDWAFSEEESNYLSDNYSFFKGYDILELNDTTVLKHRIVSDKKGESYHIVLKFTPFYAESGGQVGDTGTLQFDDEIINVIDTKKENDLIIHIVDKLPSNLYHNVKIIAKVDKTRRQAISQNHTAVHLMHAALHEILGSHAVQKGQNVDDKRLRFDFSHFNAVTKDELAAIEKLVNQKIRENIALHEVRNMPIEDARKTGAMMLFGEKYGETVRVITFDKTFSQELCGGTHVAATGEIGLFKIVSESAVAAGVRRLEAVTADAAEAWVNEARAELNQIRTILKNPKDAYKRILDIQEDIKKKQKTLQDLWNQAAARTKDELIDKFQTYGNINLLVEEVQLANSDVVKTLVHNLESQKGNAVIVLGNVVDGKAQLTIAISQEVVKVYSTLHAGSMIRELCGAGGQPFFATGGNIDELELENVFRRAKKMLPTSIRPLTESRNYQINNWYTPNSVFTQKLFKKFVLDEYEANNNKTLPDWDYYHSTFNKRSIREKILRQGQADFNVAYNDGTEYYLQPFQLVDMYCYYYMQMHYTSSLGIFTKTKNLPFINPILTDNRDVLFLDFGCGPFTSGAAFIEFYNQLGKEKPLKMYYVGIDSSEAMLERAELIAKSITEGESQFNFTNEYNDVDNYIKSFEKEFKTLGKRHSVIVNLCYLMASPCFELEENLNKFADVLNRIIEKCHKSDNVPLCFIYQNPRGQWFHKNWEKLKKKIQLDNLVKRVGTINYRFDDETGSWSPEHIGGPKQLNTDFEFYFNETV